MKLILLSQGFITVVDDQDYDYLIKWNWYVLKTAYGRNFYAIAYDKNAKNRIVYMHRIIMKPESKLVVDHIDGDGLNNLRSNLRICTQRENAIAAIPFRKCYQNK
jgi:hypothetical protein